MDGGPDELYTLRAQYMLGHYNLAVAEAKQLARRPGLSEKLKAEREEFLMRTYVAAGLYDNVLDDSVGLDTPALQAIALQAQYHAAVGDAAKQDGIVDQIKTLATSTDESSCGAAATTHLVAAQVCLAADQTAAAYGFVVGATPTTPETTACKIQILLKLNRLDLAKKQLETMKNKYDEEGVVTELCSVYVNLATGSSAAGDAEHTIMALAEQYGPSVFLLNLLAAALAAQGDCEAAETKLQEALKDFPEVKHQHHDTYINLIAAQTQQNKAAEAAESLQHLLQNHATNPSQSSTAFCAGLERVQTAFDREAVKFKV